MWVGDIEANGFLGQATKVHCAVFKHIDTGEVKAFYPDSEPDYIMGMLSFLDTVDILCMHNGVGYDIPLLRKLYDYEFKGQLIDTLLMSRIQRPKRKKPEGCTSGPHSVEAWGLRFGVPKPEHDEWRVFSDEMLHRCKVDVDIQEKIYRALVEEGKDEGWADAHKLTARLFTLLLSGGR